MKKEYAKPEVEYVVFYSRESIATDNGGDTGLNPGWGDGEANQSMEL